MVKWTLLPLPIISDPSTRLPPPSYWLPPSPSHPYWTLVLTVPDDNLMSRLTDDVSLTLPASDEKAVAQGEWRYYRYFVPANQVHTVTLTVMVPPSSSNADADVYIRKGTDVPTRSVYDWQHTGTGRVATIIVPAQTTGSYFVIGVYGYITVARYRLEVSATASSTCPSDCSGHGTCNVITSTCTCNSGWYGRACSQTAALAPTGYKTERVPAGTWLYYYHTVAAGTSSLNLTVTQEGIAGSAGDVDVYIKNGTVPTFANFDYADTSIRRTFSINIPNPRVGYTYYVGFYGFTESSFRWQLNVATTSGGCPNQCSGPTHGTCNTATAVCSCLPGFSGVSCNQMSTDLTVGTGSTTGQTVAGYVAQNEWNYYSVTPHTSSPLTIRVTHAQGEDCDIYVQRDRNPSRFDFLYRDITYSTETSLVVTNPLESTWRIGVLGFSACNYQITTSVAAQNTCPAQCTRNGGSCQGSSQICVCPANKAGQFCEFPLLSIRSGETVSGTVGKNQWVYYKYTGPASAFSIVLHEDTASSQAGVLWLYSSVVQSPTLTNFDWQDTSTNTNTHRINVEIQQHVTSAHYYIGVYGSPYAVNTNNAFRLTTWAAPFKK